jgi:ABC-type transporter Mla subunit MlaD
MSDEFTRNLERLEAAIADAREVTRTAHEATKDLRAATRDARTLIDKLIESEIAQRISDAAKAGLAELAQSVDQATVSATDAVFRRFDKLASMLMNGPHKGEPTLEELTVRAYLSEDAP